MTTIKENKFSAKTIPEGVNLILFFADNRDGTTKNS